MAFLDNLGKKISSTTQNVVRGTKDFTDIARLNSLISEEQRQIANLYSQIGKIFYETGEYDLDTPLGKLCLAIAASNTRVTRYTEDIQEIKGLRRCPNCGSDTPFTTVFCGVCGSKMEASENSNMSGSDKRFCAECKEEIPEAVAFCTSCGKKVE